MQRGCVYIRQSQANYEHPLLRFESIWFRKKLEGLPPRTLGNGSREKWMSNRGTKLHRQIVAAAAGRGMAFVREPIVPACSTRRFASLHSPNEHEDGKWKKKENEDEKLSLPHQLPIRVKGFWVCERARRDLEESSHLLCIKWFKKKWLRQPHKSSIWEGANLIYFL